MEFSQNLIVLLQETAEGGVRSIWLFDCMAARDGSVYRSYTEASTETALDGAAQTDKRY